jgi:hypothetical protein
VVEWWISRVSQRLRQHWESAANYQAVWIDVSYASTSHIGCYKLLQKCGCITDSPCVKVRFLTNHGAESVCEWIYFELLKALTEEAKFEAEIKMSALITLPYIAMRVAGHSSYSMGHFDCHQAQQQFE